MDVALFDYDLPPDRIAQSAAEPRDSARLMVLERASGQLRESVVRDLPALLSPGDLVVLNDTRVVPARLVGAKPSGGRVEVFLLERRGPGAWRALVGASRVPRPGSTIRLPEGFVASIVDGPDEGGAAVVRIEGPGPVEELLSTHGLPPLPPYIRRRPGDPRLAEDRARYQTVFARHDGALAAPTAGLHFTADLLDRLAARGIETATVTLHVGEGTFRALRATRTEDVVLHAESFDLPAATTEAVARARARGARVVAVGTTVVRTLESRPGAPDGVPLPGAGSTSLFIGPGHAFRFVDALLTNFHLPRSTLLMLVAAFAGRERVLDAYRAAIERGFRFYSYGDAMLVL